MSKPNRRKSRKSSPRQPNEIVRPSQRVNRLEPHAAGLDIGATEIAACVADDEGNQIVRIFGTYTVDLCALADWLAQHNAQSIAMESTGVYWIPIFELLEQRGFGCHLISSADIHRNPGRKSDVLDCQWIQTLHSYGLLNDSFRPDADLIPLRTLLRHRAQLIEHRAPHILHTLALARQGKCAEGTDANEHPIEAGAERHHWRDRAANFACNCSG